MGIFIFAYGSLMCPESCSRTLQREVLYQPANLFGYERVFNATGSAYSDKLQQHVSVRFANLKESVDSYCAGLLFEVNEEELLFLQKRESFYELIEVSEKLTPPSGRDYTFICPTPKKIDGYILKRYLKIMSEAVKSFPDIEKQIHQEFSLIKQQEILEGGFLGVSGNYKD